MSRNALGRRPRLTRRGLAVLACSVLGVVSTAIPASATPEDRVVELSADGVGYSRTLSDLFGPAVLTPLDSVSDSFWVRNLGTEPAHLAVKVVDVELSHAEAADSFLVSAGTATNPGSARLLSGANPCLTLSAGEVLQPGEAVKIVSTLGMRDRNGSQAQGTNLGFALRVQLSDQQIATVGGTACGAEPAIHGHLGPTEVDPTQGPPTAPDSTPTPPTASSPNGPSSDSGNGAGSDSPTTPTPSPQMPQERMLLSATSDFLASTGFSLPTIITAAALAATAGLATLAISRRSLPRRPDSQR